MALVVVALIAWCVTGRAGMPCHDGHTGKCNSLLAQYAWRPQTVLIRPYRYRLVHAWAAAQ
jgi:hypothetical protein